MLVEAAAFFRHYFRATNMGRNFSSREDFEVWQKKRVSTWLNRHAGRVESCRNATSLDDLPVIGKSKLMNDFSSFNLPRMTAAEGFSAFEGSGRFGKYFVGASTGTSGNRGLYIISNSERFAWLGTILGKVIPGFWRKRRKIAVILPLNSALYDATSKGSGRRLDLRFFDLTKGPGTWGKSVCEFQPHIIVAPPRVLAWLARKNDGRLSPERVISGAEVLDPGDRHVIERGLAPVEEIYMATEGLLATTCQHGKLHLAEDFVHFELQPAHDGLTSPIITDFSRKTQIMARYQMNDLLRLSEEPCPCGSPFRVVEEIVGRQDDVFVLQNGAEATPDVIRNAILDSDRRIDDFRAVQRSRERVELMFPPSLPHEAGLAASAALTEALAVFGAKPEVSVSFRDMPFDSSRKLKRVESEVRK